MLAAEYPVPKARRAGIELAAGLTDAVDQGSLHRGRVRRVRFVVVALGHHELQEAVGADLRRGVRVSHCPPDLQGFDSSFLLQLRGSLIVHGGREQAKIGGNQEELRMSVVHGYDAVVKAIVHARGLTRRIAREPLAGRWSDIHFHGRGAEFRGRRTRGEDLDDPAREQQSKSKHAQAYHATDECILWFTCLARGR